MLLKENNNIFRIYLDTSVISAYFDFNKPLRQLITEKWFYNDIENFQLFTSPLVLEEIENNTNLQLKKNMFELLGKSEATLLPINEEIETLAGIYRKSILSKEINDTLHIAIASFYGLDAIISWNFRHIVNIKTMKTIHNINEENKYKIIEILSVENIGGEKYGNL